jgi:hypothetical protein
VLLVFLANFFSDRGVSLWLVWLGRMPLEQGGTEGVIPNKARTGCLPYPDGPPHLKVSRVICPLILLLREDDKRSSRDDHRIQYIQSSPLPTPD